MSISCLCYAPLDKPHKRNENKRRQSLRMDKLPAMEQSACSNANSIRGTRVNATTLATAQISLTPVSMPSNNGSYVVTSLVDQTSLRQQRPHHLVTTLRQALLMSTVPVQPPTVVAKPRGDCDGARAVNPGKALSSNINDDNISDVPTLTNSDRTQDDSCDQ